jgi:oxygen-independent coproporphyrinogen III oxidase
MQSNSIYIHVPFCLHRCGYCDFNTYAGITGLISPYSQSVCQEIELLNSAAGEQLPVHSVYFGGGTPSLLSIEDLTLIYNSLNQHFQLLPSLEISLEANPGTISKNHLKSLYSLGVNRLSLGMQSANHDELRLLGRQHSFDDVIKSVKWARYAGFNNLNLDLIFGLPDQQMQTWMESIKAALKLKPEHLSLYALTLESGTPMALKVEAGILPEPDQDMAADMYEAADEMLSEAGYLQYEISNWARQNENGDFYSCKHNLQYWRSMPYLGVGAGAHGYIEHKRTVNISSPGAYIRRMNKSPRQMLKENYFPCTPATVQLIPIDADTEIGEFMMMGLRLVSEGVSNQEFKNRFGVSMENKFGLQIDRLVDLGLVEWVDMDRLRLTKEGRLLGNQVFKEFI